MVLYVQIAKIIEKDTKEGSKYETDKTQYQVDKSRIKECKKRNHDGRYDQITDDPYDKPGPIDHFRKA
jgi:hypothetical protein